MEVGVHLPQIGIFGGLPSRREVLATVEAAVACGAVALSANDHFAFPVPWLDGMIALAVASRESGPLDLVTSVTLPGLRGPVPVASTLAGLSCVSDGRVIAGVGPGSSAADHRLLGRSFEERWSGFEASVVELRELLSSGTSDVGRRPAAVAVARTPIPVWVASWGSPAGLRRVARLGDGWLASAYHQEPADFRRSSATLAELVAERGGTPLPHAVVTMWLWITSSPSEATAVLSRLAVLLGGDLETLRGRVCVGSVEHCAELLARYADAGCRRVHYWPVGDAPRQLAMLVEQVLPRLTAASQQPGG
ncbi:MAG TPA: LLM class flavin-dependent oxidoreductase [Microlunatus sp.]